MNPVGSQTPAGGAEIVEAACERCTQPFTYPRKPKSRKRLCEACRQARRREASRKAMRYRREVTWGDRPSYGRCTGCGYVKDLHHYRRRAHACSPECLEFAVRRGWHIEPESAWFPQWWRDLRGEEFDGEYEEVESMVFQEWLEANPGVRLQRLQMEWGFTPR
ncbi:hypothetical protein GCM10009525_41710 [Streptosporangium amethystogenes subsp. fukuiense]